MVAGHVAIEYLFVLDDRAQLIVRYELIGEGLQPDQPRHTAAIRNRRAHEKRDGEKHVGTDELRKKEKRNTTRNRRSRVKRDVKKYVGTNELWEWEQIQSGIAVPVKNVMEKLRRKR